MEERFIPEFQGYLRKVMVRVPDCIHEASGIRIFGKRIRSILFSTDISIIRNTNADAVMAVYPFTPQPVITQTIATAADIPLFVGVGGGLTKGQRVINLALHAEFQGAIGVVVNAPTPNDTILEMSNSIDIPIVITVVSESDDVEGRLQSGASILNVSAAAKTPELVKKIRTAFPKAAIIATGGPRDSDILKTIEAGANCITWTPPSSAEILGSLMDNYRSGNGYPSM